MESVKTIMEKYAAADLGERLSLFLTYRDLREEFATIDRAETLRRERARNKDKSGWVLSRVTGCLWGWQRHCGPAR